VESKFPYRKYGKHSITFISRTIARQAMLAPKAIFYSKIQRRSSTEQKQKIEATFFTLPSTS